MTDDEKTREQKIADAIIQAVKDKDAKISETKSGLIVVGELRDKGEDFPGQYL